MGDGSIHVETGGLTEFKMLRLMTAPNFDYLRRAARFVTVSALLVVAGLVLIRLS